MAKAKEAPASSAEQDVVEKGSRVAERAEAGASLATKETQAMFLEGAQAARMTFAQDEVAIPFLRPLQSNSPQVTLGDAKYLTYARPGDFINTVTNRTYSGEKGVLVFPIAFQTRFTEWVPRKRGGGFVKDHGADDSVLKTTVRDKDTNKDVTVEGNEIVRSSNYYCFLLDEDSQLYAPVLLVLAGTQLKKARAWNALIDGATAPHPAGGVYKPAPFYYGYRITTVPEKNEKGNWLGVVIRQDVSVEQLKELGVKIFSEALQYRKLVDAGRVKVAQPDEEVVDAEVTSDLNEGQGVRAF